MLRAGTPGVPAARPDGLGAAVAGSVPRGLAITAAVVLVRGRRGFPPPSASRAWASTWPPARSPASRRRARAAAGRPPVSAGSRGMCSAGALLEVATTVALVRHGARLSWWARAVGEQAPGNQSLRLGDRETSRRESGHACSTVKSAGCPARDHRRQARPR